MDSRGFNKSKSVRFDATARSQFVDTLPVRDQPSVPDTNISAQSWAKLPSQSQVIAKSSVLRSDSSDLSDEEDFQKEGKNSGSSQQQQYQQQQGSQVLLRQFLSSENHQKELKKSLKASLTYTKKERRSDENTKQLIGMISSKVMYKNGGINGNEDPSGIESSIGGIRLDEKTLLEEVFINFHDLVRKHRVKLSAALLQSEMTKRTPAVGIAMKIGMSDQTYDELRSKRTTAWRGFVGREEMHVILKRYGFFEAVAPAVFDRFAEKMKCYEKRFEKDWIHYTKLIAGAYRYKSSMSHLTKKFLVIDFKDGSRRMKAFRKVDEKLAVEVISAQYKTYLALLKLKEEKKKAEEQSKQAKKNKSEVVVSEEDKLRASMNESADHLIGILRAKISQSQHSLKEIFRMLDSDNDSYISKEEFKLAFKRADILLDEQIIEEAYFRFDFNKDDKVSFNEFLNVILGQEKNRPTSAFHLKSQTEELVTEIRKFMLSRFNNRRFFVEALIARNPNKITEEEFCSFLATNTNKEFSRIQTKTVFNFLDSEGKRFLRQDEFVEIYEHQIQKEEINVEILKELQRKEIEKRKAILEESSEFENEAKSFYEQNVDKSPQKSRMEYLTKLHSQGTVPGYVRGENDEKMRKGILQKFSRHSMEEIEVEISAQERKQKAKDARERTKIFLNRQLELESVMKNLSEQISDRLERTGKSLRDLFNIFSQKTFGYVDEEEFIIMLNFLSQKQEIQIEVIKALFFLFSNYYSRLLSYTLFEKLVLNGTQLHPLYLKFKFRFGNEFDKHKKKIADDFQRFDISQGRWIISYEDFKKILELNQIQFTEKDEKQLIADGIFLQHENNTFVSYKKLIPLIFPKDTQIQQDIFQRHSKTITRFFKMFKLRKQRKQLDEEARKKAAQKRAGSKDPKKKATFSKDSKGKAAAAASAAKKAGAKVSDEKAPDIPISDFQKIGDYMKPDYQQNPEDSENTSRVLKKDDQLSYSAAPPGASRKFNRGPIKNSLSQHMEEANLREKRAGGVDSVAATLLQQQRNKANEVVGDFLTGVINRAVGFGESLILSKEIQKKYEERPVTKDVFVALKDMEVETINIMPHCIFTSTQTGRIMALDKNSHLHQYDLVSKSKLIPLDLSIKVPLKESALLGAAFDSNSGRLYILTEKWTIEVWELGQDSSSPIGSIVLMSENVDTLRAVNSCYPRRYAGVFPNFISMSENSHQVIVVNSTCVNNSIILVDPISLCVINVIYISPGDFRMSNKLNSIINRIAPKLIELEASGVTFLTLFEGKLKQDNNTGSVMVDYVNFQTAIYNFFNADLPELSYEDWSDLVYFLDQNNSGFIDQSEFEFLFEIVKYQSVRLPDSTEQLVKLGGLSEGAFNLLNSFAKFLQKSRKSIEDAFRAFDEKSLGMISCEDFEFILQRICKGDENLKYVSQLTSFFDKDSNGMIDFKEFAEIFGIATDHESGGIHFNGRKNLMLCLQKAYEGGIDVEQVLIKADEYKEGSITSIVFRNILKWLPIGITDEELEYIMQNSVSYSDNGGVNYVKLLTSYQFKNMKANFEFKQKLADNQFEFSDEDYDDHANNQSSKKGRSGKGDSEVILEKVIVESAIYLDDFELLVYTTICPRTSQIFISKSNKPADIESAGTSEASQKADYFFNKLLARLQGHKSHNAPTIAYVAQSGCLISGEKLSRLSNREREENIAAGLSGNGTTANGAAAAAASVGGDKEERGANAEFERNQQADILIWNLQKDLLSKFETNPPWVITPTRVIESAHFDSILSFTYLPYCQLIASSSMDSTVKLWNPIARPYSLVNQEGEASVEIKPGYYKKRRQEYTVTNESFGEVRRIYTGDQTCFAVSSFSAAIPVLSNPEAVQDNPTKRMNMLEVMITCNLSKTEYINKKARSQATIRAFSVDKMQIEVPCNRHDEVIPMKFYEQLENLAIERKKKAYVNFQMYLPKQLEILKSKKTLQTAAIAKMVHLLKKISLTRFDDSQKYQMDEDVEQLFQIFTRLPSRQAFSAFLSDYDGKNKVTANELYYYLKKFRSLHPLNMQRDKFFAICKQFKARTHKGVLMASSLSENELEQAIAYTIRKKGLSMHTEFARLPSAVFEEAKGLVQANVIVSKSDFLGLLHKLGLFTNEDDFVQFMAQVDPLFSNKVSSNVLDEKFSADIIEYKLTQIQRPKELIDSLMVNMTQRLRIRLMFSLSAVEGIADGFLRKEDFFLAFEQAGITVEKMLLEEIFEFYAERFTDEEETKVLSVKYITKKFFSGNENLGMSKYLHTLGKIKSCLLDQGFSIEYLYRPISDDEVNPNATRTNRVDESSQQSSTSRKQQNNIAPSKKSPILSPLLQIGTSMFIHRVQQLQIPNISQKELKQLADFISISDNSTQQPTVTLAHFIHYMRRITTKEHSLQMQESKNIYAYVNYVLQKEDDLLEWKNRYNKDLFTIPDLRYILSKMDVQGDQVDEIIINFAQDKSSISLEELLSRMKDYYNEKPMVRDSRQPDGSEVLNTQTTDEPNLDPQASLGQLIFSPRGDAVRTVVIKRRQHMETIVNFLRTQTPELIEPLIGACEQRDTDKCGEIEIGEFCNILRFNISSMSEELLVSFQREYVMENETNKIEYHEFFNKYASKEEIQKISKMQYDYLLNPAKEDIDVNILMTKIVSALNESTVNVSYALKFIQNDQGMIPIEELQQLLELIKVDLSETENEALIEFLTENNSSLYIRSQFFLDQIYFSKQGLANQFRLEIWKIALSQIEQSTVEHAKTNQVYIERFVRQKQQLIENSLRTAQRSNPTGAGVNSQAKDSEIKWPLVNAEIFSKALSEQLQHDFDAKQQEELLAFAIVGCQLNEEKARAKAAYVSSSEFQLKKEVIHMSLFSKGLTEMAQFIQSLKKPSMGLNSKQESQITVGQNANNTSMDSQLQQQSQSTMNANTQAEKQVQYLVSKIKGQLKDYGVSLWDALLSTNLSVTENSKVPAAEFKFIINSLNLKLSLQEKILLSRIADPSNSNKCDITLLMRKIESDDEITDHARHLILEKFSTALFYNDMSLPKAFTLFDEDGDGVISQQEFVIGMKQLNLGLSIFEIKKLMSIIDIDLNQQISKIEFIRAMSEKNQAFKIDPLKDFSLNLLTTIRSMINLKGADLMQAFEEIDSEKKGYTNFNGLKAAMIRFGLQNVKSYHLLTIYKIYKSKPKVKEADPVKALVAGSAKNSMASALGRGGPAKAAAAAAANMKNSAATFKDNYSVSPMKPSRIIYASDAVSRISDTETERLSLSFIGDDIDQQQIEEERIDYKDLCKKIMAAVDVQAKSTVEQTNDLLRKLYKLFEQKKVSLFEAFVYFDVNGTNTISQLELRVGLKNIEVNFPPADFDRLFKAFEKTPSGKFTFNSFFNRFIESGALTVVKFDDTLELTLKKFAQKISKLGNFEQAFNKLDLNQSGQVGIIEFKDACKRLSIGLKVEEVEMVFKSLLNADNMNFRKQYGMRAQDDLENEGDKLAVEMLANNGGVFAESIKTFKYRHFVKLMSQFTGKTQNEQVLYKLYKKAQERKINWKLVFQQASSGSGLPKKKPVKAGAGGKANTLDQVADISLSQCKNMLNSLKLGLTLEEVDLVVNSFQTVTVQYSNFIETTMRAAQKLGDIEYERTAQLSGLISGINLYLDKNRTKMSQIFKDFNNIEPGKLRLSELNNIVRFMQIDANIHAIKLLFTTIDIDGKEYISLNELNNALADAFFASDKQANSQKENADDQVLSEKQRKDIAKLEDIKGLIKIKLAERQKSLSQEVIDLGFSEQEALNEKSLEALMTNMQVGLKKSDVSFFYSHILKAQQAQAVGSLSFQSLLDYSIREQIEQIMFDENVNFIHPTVAVCVDKIGSLFKRLEIDALKGFKYLAKFSNESIERKEFLKIFQSLDRTFTVDELLLIYSYFDERNNGEVLLETFVEKFEHIAYSSLAKLNKQNEKEILDAQKGGSSSGSGGAAAAAAAADDAPNLQKRKISTKQHVQGIMQKIFFFMQEKRYNKKQLKAVFDRNGNGILSREELLESLKLLQLGVPMDKARILLDFIDREETGKIEIDAFIADIFESIPQQYKKMYTHGNVIKILNDIVSRLGVHTPQFLNDLVACERSVRPVEENSMIFKVKSGISIFDFHRVLRNHGTKLSDTEKDEVKNMFVMRVNQDYFDLETIYDMIETIAYQRRASLVNSKSFVEISNVSNIWEQDVYRRIAEYLRKHNLDVEQAFHKIDQDNSGLISSSEFRRFIESLDLDLSEIKLQAMIRGYFNGVDQGTISMQSFKNKFWDAYIRYGRTDIAKQVNPRIENLEKNKKKVLTYIYMTLREFTKGSMEKAWAILDQRKIGQVEINDFRKSLVYMGVYLTREELKAAFSFIDRNSSSVIRYLEFVDFWIGGEEKLMKTNSKISANFAEGKDSNNGFNNNHDVPNENGDDDDDEKFGSGMNRLLELEESILEHICKVINQREISLWDCFKFFDTEQLGYLTRQQFSEFMEKIGVYVEDEEKIINLMRIIDPKAFGDVVHLSSLEARLSRHGLQVYEKGVVEKIEWLDRPLALMIVAMNQYLQSRGKNIEEFFMEYDGDYDGFLTPIEFFNSFSYVGSSMGILNSAIQRLSHKLASRKSFEQGKINIADMCEYLSNLIAAAAETAVQQQQPGAQQKNKEDEYSIYITIDKPVFSHILIHFDGFSSLFNQIVTIKTSYLNMKRFLSGKKNKIRGLQLISKQNSLLFLASQFHHIQGSIQDGIRQLRRQAQELIIEGVCKGVLDPAKNNYAVIDKQKIIAAQTEIDITNYRIILDDGIFQRDEGSLKYFTPYIRYFSGSILSNGGERVDMFVYSKEVLNFTCADGNKFMKILDFELKLHTLLSIKHDFMVANKGVFLKRIGHELADIEYLVINEALDPAEYMCLADMIEQNGGLFRIPVLVKLRSVTFLLKYIAKQILDILHAVHHEACFLNILRPENLFIHRRTYRIKLANVRGAAKYDLFSRISMIPDLPFNLVQRVGPLAAETSHLGYSDYFANVIGDSEFKKFYDENLHRQPYLAPEMVLKPTSEWNAYTDVWTFGSLMYHVLFGKPPKSFYQSLVDQYANVDHKNFTEPSPFFHYDIFSDELAQEILRVDYSDNRDAKIDPNFIPPNDISMVKAIEGKSFGNIFNKIFPSAGNEFEREFQQLSEMMDLIAGCLQFKPSARPTIEAMLQSSIFKQDAYESQRSVQIFETVFFYKSPSTTLREKAFDPLRQLCALAIKTPEKIDNYQIDILRIIDFMNATVSAQPNSKIDRIKRESNLGAQIQQSQTPETVYSAQLPQQIRELLAQSEQQRNKHANTSLVQFMFMNDLLDMLVFLALRHHKQITLSETEITQKTSLKKAHLNHDKMMAQRDRSIQVLTGLRELMKVLVYQLDVYSSAVAPFVHKLLENLVKLFIGEEYMLQSDMISELNRSVGTLPARNLNEEYAKQQPTRVFSRFFNRTIDDAVMDEADTLWATSSMSRPYIFMSRNWSPTLYNIVGSLYKSTVGEAGVGRSNYPVLQDYIRFCSDKYAFVDSSSMSSSSSSRSRRSGLVEHAPRGADYYNDLINMAENFNVLYASEKFSGDAESLKQLLNYFKIMLKSNNTDKIKLFLDSRASIFLIPYLNSDDIQVRTNLLEIFLEISMGFANLNYSYANQRDLKSEEPPAKNYGIVSHMNQVFEDKIERKRFLECAKNFYFLKQQTNRMFLFQIAFTFETPSVITNLFQVFKTKAELMNSKILVLRIFANLVNGPESIVHMLNIASIDVFPSVLKLLIKPKIGSSTQELKSTKILAPIVSDIFKEIVKHARSEIIDSLENTPGVRSLLREVDLVIPNKLNLNQLSGQIANVQTFFVQERDQIIREIKAAYLNHNLTSKGVRDAQSTIRELHGQSLACLDHILSWFKHYFFTCKDVAVIVEARRLVDYVVQIGQSIIQTLKEYAAVNAIALDIITLYAVFLENISNMGLHYIVFNKHDNENSIKLAEWMFAFIENTYKVNSEIDAFEDVDSLKVYHENVLIPTAHIFMRILVTLTEVNKSYVHEILNRSGFGRFFIELVAKQHHLVRILVNAKTIQVPVLQAYVEETNFRVVCFENILKSSNVTLKDYLMENDFVKMICQNAFQHEQEISMALFKNDLKTLPFRNFAPLRNEALTFITTIIWHKVSSERMYKDLLIQIANEQLIKRECANLRKNSQKSNSFLSALYFFTVLVNTGEEKLLFLMKFEKVFEFLHEFFDRNIEFKKYFPILFGVVRKQYSGL